MALLLCGVNEVPRTLARMRPMMGHVNNVQSVPGSTGRGAGIGTARPHAFGSSDASRALTRTDLQKIYLEANNSPQGRDTEMCVKFDNRPKKRVSFSKSENHTIDANSGVDTKCRC